jgi:hypothetical protein
MQQQKQKKDRQNTYNAKIRRVRLTIVAVEKQLSIIYYECVYLALVSQHAKRMHLIIQVFSPVACPSPYHISPNCLANDTIFRGKKNTEHKMRVLIIYANLSETFPILKSIEILNLDRYSCKGPVILVGL